MSKSETIRSALAQLVKKEAALVKLRASHRTDEGKALADAGRHAALAAKTKSESARRSHLLAAERAHKKAVTASVKESEAARKIAANSAEQAKKLTALGHSERLADRQAEQQAARRRAVDIQHARNIARISQVGVRYVAIQAPIPEKFRLLYLTSNPTVGDKEFALRTETEVRQVQQTLRAAAYRDLVDMQVRPAATFQDLLDGLNDVRPHAVHFSGHGGEQSLEFELDQLFDPAGHRVNFSLVMQALAATDMPPRLLVLNACDTVEGAEAILPAVPVIIAMNETVDDIAAVVFARQFYAAVASGQSIGAALRQAKVGVEAAALNDTAHHYPNVVSREGVDIDTLVLVTPPS